MIGYQSVQWAVGSGTKDGHVKVELEPGQDFHIMTVVPPQGVTPDAKALDCIRKLLDDGRLEWDGRMLRIFFPVRK